MVVSNTTTAIFSLLTQQHTTQSCQRKKREWWEKKIARNMQTSYILLWFQTYVAFVPQSTQFGSFSAPSVALTLITFRSDLRSHHDDDSPPFSLASGHHYYYDTRLVLCSSHDDDDVDVCAQQEPSAGACNETMYKGFKIIIQFSSSSSSSSHWLLSHTIHPSLYIFYIGTRKQ